VAIARPPAVFQILLIAQVRAGLREYQLLPCHCVQFLEFGTWQGHWDNRLQKRFRSFCSSLVLMPQRLFVVTESEGFLFIFMFL